FTTDLSEASAGVYQRGLELVAALRTTDDLELRALLVLGEGFGPPPPLPPAALEDAGKAELERFLARIEGGSTAAHGTVRTGDPTTEIVAEAAEWGADLLMLGTQG